MTKRIWKYPLRVTDSQTITIPKGSEILSVQEQAGNPTLWVLVDDRLVTYSRRTFRIYGTGHALPEDPGKFIGTVQLNNARVWHVFEE